MTTENGLQGDTEMTVLTRAWRWNSTRWAGTTLVTIPLKLNDLFRVLFIRLLSPFLCHFSHIYLLLLFHRISIQFPCHVCVLGLSKLFSILYPSFRFTRYFLLHWYRIYLLVFRIHHTERIPLK
jgi:hypothetical protein